MNTKTQDKTTQQTNQGFADSRSKGEIAVRPQWDETFAKEFNIGPREFSVLSEAIWPGAKTTASIRMALSYCKSRKLDPFKRPVHIVPVYSTALKKTIETVWPGIAELRTTAMRTQAYAGCDPTLFGDDFDFEYTIETEDEGRNKTKIVKKMKVPSWAQITVYRMVHGQRVAFPGPRVMWKEAYASKSYFSDEPNDMWKDRSRGQLEKCAEAAALRKAFPEELGGELTAEEMWGKTIEGSYSEVSSERGAEAPPRPQRSDFTEERSTTAQQRRPAPAQQKPAEAARAPAQETAAEAEAPKPVETPTPPASAPSKPEPQTSLRAKGDEFSVWLADSYDELAKISDPNFIDALQDQVSGELNGDQPALEQWTLACNNRARDLLAAQRTRAR